MIFLNKLEKRIGYCSVANLTLVVWILTRDHAMTLDLSDPILTLAASFKKY